MEYNPIDISFITVNYNGLEHTRNLLQSMQKYLKNISYETLIIDNGSLIDESHILSKEFSNYIFIRSEVNLGFAGGNNLGIKQCIGRYIMLINNDTLFIDSSMKDLIRFMDNNSSVAACSPKILFFKPAGIIQYAGYTDLTKITLRNSGIGFGEKDLGQYNLATETFFTHGAAMIVRKTIIEKIGLMPECYFLYYEEMEWCYKMRQEGYELWFYPHTKIVHKESMSIGASSSLKIYYLTRNRLLFASRNRRGLIKLLALIYQLLIAIPAHFFKSVFIGRFDFANAIVRGTFSFFRLQLN